MAWWDFGAGKRAALRDASALTAAASRVEQMAAALADRDAALTAAAAPPRAPQAQFMRKPEKWQLEAWGYYDSLGEYEYGVRWLSHMLSRVRLRAAQIQPDSDEPTLLEKGPAVDAVNRLGAIGQQSELMRRATTLLSVPGEGYLVGETTGATEKWMMRSVEEIRAANGGYEVQDELNPQLGLHWRQLPQNSLVVRVWRPHDRFYHLATSPSRAALATMRELELVNRKILSQYLSRLASAGLLVLPEEITFPVREEFAEADDPFMEEFLEIAKSAIQNPGQASAVVPIPIRVPGEYVDKVKFVDFTVKQDDKIIEKRDQVVKRLASQLDLPSDVLQGLSDMNHWNAYAMEESGLKVHIAPIAEIICAALTDGFLKPALEAAGEDASDIVVWYDMSELTLRPDRTQAAFDAYDRLEINGDALRRETGFDPNDQPEGDDLQDQLLKGLIRSAHGAAPAAIDVLLGKQILTPATQGPGSAQAPQVPIAPPGEPNLPSEVPPPPASKPGPASGPAKSPGPPGAGSPPAPDAKAAAALARAMLRTRQAQTQHIVSIRPDGQWDLKHPALCADHTYSCPFTHAVTTSAPIATPGAPGQRYLTLDAFGNPRVGGQTLYEDTSRMISTLLTPGRALANGAAHV